MKGAYCVKTNHSAAKGAYKLKRVFNIFSARVYVYLLLWAATCTTIAIINQSNLITALAGLSSTVVLLVYLTYCCPAKLFITENTIEFTDYHYIRPRFVGGNWPWLVKVDYYVESINNLELHQNAIERLFDVGHISFNGQAHLEAKRDVDRVKVKERFVIFGISNFSAFKSCFEE